MFPQSFYILKYCSAVFINDPQGEFHKCTSDNDQKDKQMATGESTDSDDKGLKLSQGEPFFSMLVKPFI